MAEGIGLRRSRILPILGLLIALSACDDPSADELIERARESRQKGEISASIIDLRNALQKAPKHAEARYLLGQNHLAVGDLASAEKEFLRARDYGFSNDKLAQPLAEIWLAQRQFVKALEQLRVDELSSEASKIAVLIAHGRAHQALGTAEAAKADFEKALALDPDNAPALVGLARIAMQLGQDREAEVAVARAAAAAPENLNVISLQGDHDFRRGDFAAAEIQYRRLLDAGGDNLAVRLALAQAQIYLGKTDQARAHLDNVLARAEGHVDANYLRASLAFQAEDYEAARHHSERVLAVVPDHLPSLLIAGASNYLLGRLEKANRYLSAVLAKNPEHRLAGQLYAATRMRLARPQHGGAGLAPLLDDSLDPRRLPSLVDPEARARDDLEAARAYLSGLTDAYAEVVVAPQQRSAEAIDAARSRLRATLEQSPRDVESLVRLAKLEHEAGNDVEAASLLESAIAADPYALAPRALLGQLHLYAGRPSQALEATRTALRDHSEHPVLLAVAGLAQLHSGRPGDAKLIFRSLVEVAPGSAAAQYLLALAYRDEGDAARYRQRLDEVLRLDPGHFRARVAVARLMAQGDELAAASELAEDLLRAAPEDPQTLDLMGTITLLEGRRDDAVALLRRAVERAPGATAVLKLAYAQQRAGDVSGSRATLTGWLARSPGDLGVRLVLANKLLAAGALGEARSHYAKIVLLAPNNVVALNNLAWVDLQLGDVAAALEGIERAHQLAPDDPRVVDTYGLVQLRAGNAEAAARALRRAASEMPDRPQIQAHLAQALAEQGAAAEAREILRRILSENTDFPGQAEAQSLLLELGG